MADIRIHHCKGVVASGHNPDNGNHIMLTIRHEVRGIDSEFKFLDVPVQTNISLFDLPEEVTAVLMEHFGPKEAEAGVAA